MSSPRPPLKTVPPTQIPPKKAQKIASSSPAISPQKPAQKISPPSPSTSPPPTETSISSGGFRLGAIALILTIGGYYILSPATIYVKGVAHFEPHEDRERSAFLDFPGKVTKFWVRYGQEVEKGEPIAEVDAIALESEIAQKKAQLQEKQAQLETQKTQITILEAELIGERRKTAIAQRREQDFRNQLNRGLDAPEIQKIMQEISAIETRLINIKSERVKSIQQLQGVEKVLQQYETPAMIELREAGGIGAISLAKQLMDLESQKVTLQAQVYQQDQRALEIKHQIQAKSAELGALQENRQEKLQERQDEFVARVSNLVPLQRKLDAAKITADGLIPVIKTLEREMKKLEERYPKNTIIKSPLTGTIITPDLPQKIGQKITEDKPILTVANLDEMVATIEITQGDAGLVKQVFGQRKLTVKLKPREIEIKAFDGSIKDIEPLFDSDESGQKQLMRVRATFDNRDRFLSPNSEADASIAVERLPRYRIWWREIWKQLRQYF